MPQPFPRMRKVRGIRRSKRDWSDERGCLEKVRYDSWALAEKTVLRIIEENIELGRTWRSNGLATYRCGRCEGWHVGHSRGPRDPLAPAPSRASSSDDEAPSSPQTGLQVAYHGR